MVDVYTRLRDKLQKFNPNLTFLTLSTKNLEAIKIHLSESMYNKEPTTASWNQH